MTQYISKVNQFTWIANKFKVDGDNYDVFPETKDEKEVYYYACEWKLKCYKGKDGDVQYTRK